ncbi:MAG: ion channel activity [Peltula sp. TS41687]|nr:MAG: ion channel activity [Peltula sp. TS41687]
MGNDALKVNPHFVNGQASDIHITTHGSNWYWAVCAVMTVATLAILADMFRKPRSWRAFHYITASITLVAAIAYFTMASNLGWTPIPVQYLRGNALVRGTRREIFYVRYIDWFITTPLLLLDILLTAALPWPTILFVLLLDLVMIVCGLVGALVRTSYKWGFFVFGCAALLGILYHILWTGRKHSAPLGPDVSRVYLMVSGWTIFLWFLYPIAWGLSEGGNVISPDSEAIFYGILDILAKVVFGGLLLWGHRNIEPRRLGLHIRDYDEVPYTHQRTGIEKGPGHNGIGETTAIPVVPATTTAAV